MKKFLTLLLALVMILSSLTVYVSADTDTPTQFTLFLDGKTNTTLFTSAENEGVVTYTSAGANLKAIIDDSVEFKYSNKATEEKIVTLDTATGKVTPLKAGTVTIWAYNATGDKLGNYTITVQNRTVVGFAEIKTSSKTYYVGDKLPLDDYSVKFKYDNGDIDSTAVDTSKYKFEFEEGYVDNGGRLLIPGDNIKVWILSAGGEVKSDPFSVKVITNVVTKLTLTISGGAFHFNEGDDFPGLNVKAKFTNSSEATVAASQYDIEIYNGSEWIDVSGSRQLQKTDKKIRVYYNGVYSNEISITVTEKSTDDDDDDDDDDGSDTSDYMGVVSGTFKTKSYRVGDKIDWTGITIVLKHGDEVVTTLNSDLLSAFSGIENHAFARKFTKDDVKGDGKTNFVIKYEYNDNEYLIPLTEFTVKDSLGTLVVYEIDAVVLNKKTYKVGDTLSLSDINYVQYASNASNSKVVMGEDLEKYSNAMTIMVLSSTGKVKTSKSSTIEESDIFTKNGETFVNVRFMIDTKHVDTTVAVSNPDVAVYYDGKLIETYGSLEEALEAVEALSISDYPPAALKTVSIRIRNDEKLPSNFKFEVERRIEIDLNGKKLTMDSDTLDPDMGIYFLTISNSSNTAATLVYDDVDITVSLAKNDSVVFEDEYDEDDLLPGVYAITLDVGDNGEVESDPKANRDGEIIVGNGTEIEITVTPDEGYMVDEIAIGTKKVNKDSSSYTEKDGVVTFKFTVDEDMNGDTLSVDFAENDPLASWDNPFRDVTAKSDYYDAVAFVNINGLFNGTSETMFSPSSTMTRAMFVTVLGRLCGIDADLAGQLYSTTSSEFTDVKKGDSRYSYYSYAVPYINWATREGLIEGYGNGKFGPENPITHQQMYVIMQRYADSIEGKNTNAGSQTLKFVDKASIADWATDAVKYAQKMDFIVETDDNKISPTTNAKRFELAMLIQKFCINVLEWEE